jgi:hypothetical protein
MGLLILLAVVCCACAGIYCLHWVLSPLEQAAKERQCAVHFTLGDVFCLFVLVQLTLGLTHWATCGEFATRAVVGFDIVLCGIVAFVWWLCARTMSLAGIEGLWQRCFMLMAALPVMIAGGIYTVCVLYATIDLLWGRHNGSRDVYVLLGGGLLAGVIYVFGRITRAIVASTGV